MSELLRGSALLSLGTLLSRILGYVRDAVVAYAFGATPLTDGFFVAYRLPNLFRRVLGEGAVNAALLPLYGEALKKNEGERFLAEAFFWLSFLSALTGALGSLFAEQLVLLLAPGLKGKESFQYAVFFTRYVFPYLFLVALYAAGSGALMVKGRFFVPSVSQALFNLTFITVTALGAEGLGPWSLVLGVLLGGVAQNLPNFLLGLKEGLVVLPRPSWSPRARLFLKRLLTVLGSFSAGQLSLLVDTFLASFLREGFISVLYYASRLYTLPVSLFSVGLGSAMLALSARTGGVRERFLEALSLSWALALPAATGLFLLAEEIVKLLFGRGAFGPEEVSLTARLVRFYAFSVPFFSLQHVFKSYFYAKGKPGEALRATVVTVLTDALVASSALFVFKLGVYAFPAGATAGAVAGVAFLKLRAGLPLMPPALFKYLLATAAMSAAVFLSPQGSVRVFLIPVYAAVYFLFLALLKERASLSVISKIRAGKE
ncbi:MAG: murein biosynthesis integral membrane protein MurJ [Aquificae bacterium]|nr:murein biosynthesis integral membrane protein MurJ [Aquificota bacterium]